MCVEAKRELGQSNVGLQRRHHGGAVFAGAYGGRQSGNRGCTRTGGLGLYL